MEGDFFNNSSNENSLDDFKTFLVESKCRNEIFLSTEHFFEWKAEVTKLLKSLEPPKSTCKEEACFYERMKVAFETLEDWHLKVRSCKFLFHHQALFEFQMLSRTASTGWIQWISMAQDCMEQVTS